MGALCGVGEARQVQHFVGFEKPGNGSTLWGSRSQAGAAQCGACIYCAGDAITA
jgi:hypothetical protein